MIGRDRELERIQSLTTAGRPVLIFGEAGIGKSTLWRAAVAAARANGARVLGAEPAQAEQSYSYAVLADLMEAAGEAPRGNALAAAVGGSPVDARAVAVALRSLLTGLGRDRPVLVAIDDVQWVDAASAGALSFALRRTPAVSTLTALRRGERPALVLPATEVEVGPMSAGAIHHLLATRLDVRLPRPQLLRLHELSGGNPFFALELARAGTAAGRTSLAAVVAARLESLSPGTRRALAVLALTGSTSEGGLDEAIEADVVRRRDGQLRFAHPLFAEGVVALLTASERRRLHRELAEVTKDDEQRARHLALSAEEPDAEIALLIEEAAVLAMRRGAIAASGDLWRSAAELTPEADAVRRAERFVEAGVAELLGGTPDAGTTLIEQNLTLIPDGPLRQRGRIHAILMRAREDSRLVVEQLESSLAEVTDAAARQELIHLLCAFLSLTGESGRAAEIAHAHVRDVEQHAPALLGDALMLAAGRELECDRPPWELVDRARAAAADTAGDAAIAWKWNALPIAYVREGRLAEARAALDVLSLGGSVYDEGSLLAEGFTVELAEGHAATAAALADETLATGEQIGAPYMICGASTALALALGWLGRTGEARALLDRALELATEVHATTPADAARLCLAWIEASEGRLAEAGRLYEAVADETYARRSQLPGGRAALDAVETLSALGLHQEASRIAGLMPTDARERPLADACIAAARGSVVEAVELVRSATPSAMPFAQARESLLLGRLLGDARQRAEARSALEDARERFARLEAPLWAARASERIARLGGRTPSGQTLTASERRVAELVASGLSNKEVAARLVVTPRTVEAHLSRVYAKLGLETRTALAARWPEL